jgi:hypothetical protein
MMVPQFIFDLHYLGKFSHAPIKSKAELGHFGLALASRNDVEQHCHATPSLVTPSPFNWCGMKHR